MQRLSGCRLDAARHVSRRRSTPRSVMIAVTSAAGVTSNAGFQTRAPAGAARAPRQPATSSLPRCSIGMWRAVGRGRIDRERRRRDVERHAVRPRRERQRRRSRSCWPRRHWRRSGRRRRCTQVDVAPAKPARRHAVGDHRDRHAGARQLPRREPAALQQRARLVGDHRDAPPGLVQRVDRRERGADPAGGERARVAVRQHGASPADQLRARRADPRAHRAVLVPDGVRLGHAAPSGGPRRPSRRADARRSIRSSAHRRLTAVGRVAPSTADARRTASSVSDAPGRERHAPSPPRCR